MSNLTLTTKKGKKNDSSLQFEVKEYHAVDVNALLHIQETRELELDEDALECGELFLKYDVCDSAALSRLHNHFKLKDGERIVVTVEESCKSRRKVGLTGKQFVKKAPREARDDDVPYIFRFGVAPDGKLLILPLEYISKEGATKKLAVEVEKRVDQILSNEGFLKSLNCKIRLQQNLKNFGFQAIYEDLVLEKPNSGDVLHEHNWYRYQEMSYREFLPDTDSTVTSWRFKKDENNGTCYCVGRCYCWWSGSCHYHLSDGHNQYD